MSKILEEKAVLMEAAYDQWLRQRQSSIDHVGFDPIHPLFAGWTIGFEDGVSACKNDKMFKNIILLILGLGLGSLR